MSPFSELVQLKPSDSTTGAHQRDHIRGALGGRVVHVRRYIRRSTERRKPGRNSRNAQEALPRLVNREAHKMV